MSLKENKYAFKQGMGSLYYPLIKNLFIKRGITVSSKRTAVHLPIFSRYISSASVTSSVCWTLKQNKNIKKTKIKNAHRKFLR
jgi:hypothetical protein